MEFKVVVSPNAHEEIELAFDYYDSVSYQISNKFMENVEKTYHYLSINPFYSIRYKNYRAITITKFPFLLFFTIDEENKMVYVLSCFQTAQNPEKYPI